MKNYIFIVQRTWFVQPIVSNWINRCSHSSGNRFWIVHYSTIEVNFKFHLTKVGIAVAQWSRCCVTNRKVAGSIPAGVLGFFIDIKSFRSHYGPGVDSASNNNEYQEYFLGVKAVGA